MNWKLVTGFVLVVALALFVLFKVRGCQADDPPTPPDNRPQIPVTEKPAVNRNEQSLPPTVRPENVRGRLRVTVKDTTTGRETTVDILVPSDDSTPTILVDTTSFGPTFTIAEYVPFRDPWVLLEPDIFLGGSVSSDGVSPFAGVSFVSLTRFNLRAGAGANLWGGGVFVAWEFYKSTFNLHIQYSPVHWDKRFTANISAGISLRL